MIRAILLFTLAPLLFAQADEIVLKVRSLVRAARATAARPTGITAALAAAAIGFAAAFLRSR